MSLPLAPFGHTGLSLPRFALGCMGMSDFYGPANRAESIATIHAAKEAGVVMLDTGDFYGMGDNEMLLRRQAAGTHVHRGEVRCPARPLRRLCRL